MQCDYTLRAIFKRCSRLALPCEFHIALITKYRNVVFAAPSDDCTHVVERTSWVTWRVHPNHECALCIVCTDLCEIKTTGCSHWHCYWSATGQCCAHCITWVAHSRKQHSVASWGAQLHPLRCSHYKLFTANARSNLCKRNVNVELALNP